jgi:fungal STAND N-terminal Goodbye domain
VDPSIAYLFPVLHMSRSCQGHLPHSIQSVRSASRPHVRRSNLFSPLLALAVYSPYYRAPTGSGLLVSMSSSTTLSGSSASRLQFIFENALQDYTKQTGVDLTKYDFINQLERSGSPDEVLMLLRDKAKKFKEYRDGNRKLINWITPVVQVVHLFAGFLEEATSIVSRKAFKPFKWLF